jgi:hypothetical protein
MTRSEELKLPSENTNITLDDLLGLVETAIRSIERLQTENALLARQLHESEDTANRAAAAANGMAAQMKELERATSALKVDAEWRKWFNDRYGNSTFFTYIEKEYLQAHPRAADPRTAIGHASSCSGAQPGKDDMHELHEAPQSA